MEQRIKNVMASAFTCDISEISENASPDTIEQWDSLKHMNLIVALEEEFGVTFSEDEIVEMLNYKLIRETLKGKNIK
jgi:acyl carrier protein